jgi:hypothetical protein
VKYLLLLLVLCASCAAPRWVLKPGPDDPKLTTMERSGIIEGGELNRMKMNPFEAESSVYYYSWTERLMFMKSPVTVVSMSPRSPLMEVMVQPEITWLASYCGTAWTVSRMPR